MQPVSYEILIKYFAGEASPAEALHIDEWRNDNPENEKYFIELFNSWNEDVLYASPDVDKFWNEFALKTKHNHIAEKPTRKKLIWQKVAAALALILVAGYFIFIFNHQKQVSYTAVKMNDTFTLPDDAIIVLDKDAKASYTINKENIHVKLQGNAYVEIKNHTHQIKLELASGLQIQDIGTKFKIEQNKLSNVITLYNGKLKISSAKQSAILENSKVFNYNIADEKFSTSAFTGTFDFKDRNVKDICNDLSAYYHTVIKIENQNLASQSLTIKCHDASLEEVVNIITSTLEASSGQDEHGNIIIK